MNEFFTIYNISVVVIAYLIGSVPSSIWVGKWFFGIDVRDFGSKNAGATNTFRTIGKRAGFPVLFFDIFKGWAAVYFLSKYSIYSIESNTYINLQIAIGIAAVLGHIFPIYERFKGGKGVATLLGIVLAINFPAAAICFFIFLVVYLISHYVSLGAIISASAFPIVTVFVLKVESTSLIYFSIALAVLVVVRHRKNIERLLNNEEGKMPFNVKEE
jgi:glycerol-3-phosphate acyltransferase PlsY